MTGGPPWVLNRLQPLDPWRENVETEMAIFPWAKSICSTDELQKEFGRFRCTFLQLLLRFLLSHASEEIIDPILLMSSFANFVPPQNFDSHCCWPCLPSKTCTSSDPVNTTQLNPWRYFSFKQWHLHRFLENREMFSQLSPKDLSAPKLHLHPFKREKGGNHKNLPKKTENAVKRPILLARLEGGVLVGKDSKRKKISEIGWWFQILFFLTPIWGNDPNLLRFFKWVETTSYIFWLAEFNLWPWHSLEKLRV